MMLNMYEYSFPDPLALDPEVAQAPQPLKEEDQADLDHLQDHAPAHALL